MKAKIIPFPGLSLPEADPYLESIDEIVIADIEAVEFCSQKADQETAMKLARLFRAATKSPTSPSVQELDI